MKKHTLHEYNKNTLFRILHLAFLAFFCSFFFSIIYISFVLFIGWRSFRPFRIVELARSVDDPSKGFGDRRSGVGCQTGAPARVPCHLGDCRRRTEGQPVHGHHLRHFVPVAGHRLSHTGQ